jgi:hypothetical protein
LPNIIAYLALLGWPLVTRLLFTRFGVRDAICWSIVGGYLLLPTGFGLDAPLLPTFDKSLAPALAVFVICLMGGAAPTRLSGRKSIGSPPPMHVQPLPGWTPKAAMALLLLALAVLTPIGTALLNTDPIRVTDSYILRGTSYYDGLSFALQALVAVLPLLIGRRYLHDEEAHRRLFYAIFMGGVAYIIPVLAEVRLSPQLHSMIYGYFPSDWRQQKRFGGFRPVVFLQHGLWVAIYMAMATASAVAMWRINADMKRPGGLKYFMLFVALFFSLILCKSVGAVLLVVMMIPAIAFLSPRKIMLICAVFGTIVLTYPAARGVGAIPIEKTIAFAESISAERAESLTFRVRNEELLLERAAQRPLFGWGSWGRSLVFDDRGSKKTIQDGLWIIIIGQHGWLGYIATFGLLVLPVLSLALFHGKKVSIATAGLAAVSIINMLDMLPNSSLTPVSWLIAGALWGRAEALRTGAGAAAAGDGAKTKTRQRARAGADARSHDPGPGPEPTPRPLSRPGGMPQPGVGAPPRTGPIRPAKPMRGGGDGPRPPARPPVRPRTH